MQKLRRSNPSTGWEELGGEVNKECQCQWPQGASDESAIQDRVDLTDHHWICSCFFFLLFNLPEQGDRRWQIVGLCLEVKGGPFSAGWLLPEKAERNGNSGYHVFSFHTQISWHTWSDKRGWHFSSKYTSTRYWSILAKYRGKKRWIAVPFLQMQHMINQTQCWSLTLFRANKPSSQNLFFFFLWCHDLDRLLDDINGQCWLFTAP